MALLAACLWVLLAFIMQSVPSNDHHWRRAYVLIALGIPLLIWVVTVHGWLIGCVIFLVGASVLRWPLYYLYKWVRARITERIH